MGIMDRLNALDRRFGAGTTRSITLRGAQRTGITAGIFLGRVTEAKAVRTGRGALRD